MAYTTIPSAWVQAGEPTKEELFQLIRDNQEHFDAEITGLQQTAIYPLFDMKIGGYLNGYSQTYFENHAPTIRSAVDTTIVEFKMTLLSASGAGTFEVDLQKSTDNGATWSALLSSNVSISGTTVGSISSAPSWISVAHQDIAQGDLLRLRIRGVQSSQGRVHVLIYGEL